MCVNACGVCLQVWVPLSCVVLTVTCCRHHLYTTMRSQRLTQLILDEEARKIQETPANVKQRLQRLVRLHIELLVDACDLMALWCITNCSATCVHRSMRAMSLIQPTRFKYVAPSELYQWTA